jgi:hypothetical protein
VNVYRVVIDDVRGARVEVWVLARDAEHAGELARLIKRRERRPGKGWRVVRKDSLPPGASAC